MLDLVKTHGAKDAFQTMLLLLINLEIETVGRTPETEWMVNFWSELLCTGDASIR